MQFIVAGNISFMDITDVYHVNQLKSRNPGLLT
jgi:hypothetical protein